MKTTQKIASSLIFTAMIGGTAMAQTTYSITGPNHITTTTIVPEYLDPDTGVILNDYTLSSTATLATQADLAGKADISQLANKAEQGVVDAIETRVDALENRPGIAGPAGAAGAAGAAGRDGVDGRDGAQGIQGVAGQNGRDSVSQEIVQSNIEAAKNDVKAQFAQALAQNKAKTDNAIKDIKSQIAANQVHANKGIAGANAFANTPALSGNKNFAVGVGIGGYGGQSSLAISASARINKNTVVRAGYNSAGGYGAGVGVEW